MSTNDPGKPGAAATKGDEIRSTIFGSWSVVPAKSSDIDMFRRLEISIEGGDDSVRIEQRWGGERSFTDRFELPVAGLSVAAGTVKLPTGNRVFPSNIFMGLARKVGSWREVSAEWIEKGRELLVRERVEMRCSQGFRTIDIDHRYTLSRTREELVYTIKRSTRSTAWPMSFVCKPTGSREAYVMYLNDDWSIDGSVDVQAMLIGLQGLANRTGPSLYFVYPDGWDFRFTPHVLEFLTGRRNYTFTAIDTPRKAIETFSERISGYVVWDKTCRTSLLVAYTIAGIEDAIVVSEDLLPLAGSAGLEEVIDLRGTFDGMSDVEIFRWAYERYWDRCNREYIVWLGGEHGRRIKPGVADWGVYNRCFFTDLSTKKSDTGEYAMADELLSQMKPMGLVFGWHSYKKDLERDHVTLCSSHALRVEGLHTLPNMSFSSQVPVSPGFEFRNNHTIEPGETVTPERKVYIACVQTDCLGLGAWTRPGRGELPYAWEVTMNWSWLAPAMMEFFYSESTPNDFFIGSLGGPGYMYPKAIPEKYLSECVELSRKLMDTLDLNVFEFMDYSEGATVEGNSDLTREVLDAFYEGMPDAIGFANGYAPSYSYEVRDGRPLLSFDYYLSPSKSEDEAVADLHELATFNDARPYFLLLHVRQWSDITRVKSILDKLGDELEVVPLDRFLVMAGNNPTFRNRLRDDA